MSRSVCAKCKRKQGDVKFSWTLEGKKRLVCDLCFESGDQTTSTWMPATQYTIVELPPAAAEGSSYQDMQFAKQDGWRGRKF